MKTLNCKICGTEVKCDEDVIKVTCSLCCVLGRTEGDLDFMELTTDKA
tara:strand:+ start:1849 stop:1992 length:144 start_codon:yes stop_codon:yes gene_type:complete